MLPTSRLFAGLAAIVLAAAACGASPTAYTGAHVDVVASTTVFADMVRRVAGTTVDVTSVVPKGGEVHTFDPRPSDIERLAGAQLVVMNGLGLDDWLSKYVTASSGRREGAQAGRKS